MSKKKTQENKKPKNVDVTKTLSIYFIPQENNDHKPFILRPQALRFYSIILILTKIIVTGFLYLSYPSAGFFSSATTSSIVNLTNSSRQENNLPALKTSQTLNMAAYRKAQDMIANNYFSHDSPSGIKFWRWILGAGYQYTTAGENLAMDFTSAETVISALMSSTSHRANILNSKFTEIGVSVVSGKINDRDTTILVQMFGTPKAQAAPAPVSEQPSTPTPPPQQQQQKETPLPPSVTTPPSQPKTSPAPYFKAEVVSLKEKSLNIKPGEEISFWADFKNTGNTTWENSGNNFVALNLTNPAGRTSVFQHSSWIESYRPTNLKDPMPTNGTARLEFTLKAPTQEGEYQEAFQLVAENLAWIEGSNFSIPITVSKPQVVPSNVNQGNVNQAKPVNQNKNVNQNINTNINTNTAPIVVGSINTNQATPPEGTVQGEVTPTIVSSQDLKKSRSFVDYLLSYSNIIFWAVIFLVGISLLLNTFIKIRIQHASTVIPSLLVILLATLMIIFRFHFIEQIVSQPIIL